MWADTDSENPFTHLETRKLYGSMSRVAVIPLEYDVMLDAVAAQLHAIQNPYAPSFKYLASVFKDIARANARLLIKAAGIPLKQRVRK